MPCLPFQVPHQRQDQQHQRAAVEAGANQASQEIPESLPFLQPPKQQPQKHRHSQALAQNAKKIKVLEDTLLAIMIYGGEASEGINLEVPDDEVKLEELEFVYETKYKDMSQAELKKEVKDLLKSYQKELKAQKIEELMKELEQCEDDEEKSADILREIQKIQKG